MRAAVSRRGESFCVGLQPPERAAAAAASGGLVFMIMIEIVLPA